MAMPAISRTSRSTSVVLPVPDGADTMNRSPHASLDILDLLAQLLELGLRRDDQLRDADTVGLGPDGVDLAIHLLQQEVQLAAARFRAVAEGVPVHEVRLEAGDLLADVRPRRRAHDLRSQRPAIHRHV